MTSAISLCSPLIIATPEHNILSLVQAGQEQLAQLALPVAQRGYIGVESCEFLLCRKRMSVVNMAKTLHANGLAVTLVTPPVSQFMLDDLLAFISYFDRERLADEIVVNDLGLLCWCCANTRNMIVRAGRFFDRITREARFDAFLLPEFNRNRLLFETPYICQNAVSKCFSSLGVNGIELDTMPYGTLDLSDSRWDYALWYPKTALSWCTTCEFAGSALPAQEKFVPGKCASECTHYQTELRGQSVLKISKSARMIESHETRDLFSCFTGDCRVVIAIPDGGIGSESNSANSLC